MNSIITIDGPAGAGKSTVSRLLANKLHYFYLDTGAMYRAVAFKAAKKGLPFDDGVRLSRLCKDLDLQFTSENDHDKLILDGQDISLAIRSPEMDMLSSTVSAVKEVREAMKTLQRKLGSQGKIVAEGRDMGTVVFPDADHKFFITASLKERALRRYRERQARGEAITKEAVEMDLRRRDEQDTMRAIAPLRPAENARVIDTTHLNPQEVIEEMLALLWPIDSQSF
jgi:cytidylate kinase